MMNSNKTNDTRNIVVIEDFPILNGEVDDTLRFQRAINEVRRIGGGTLQLGGETYVLSSLLTLTSDLTIAGVKNLTMLDAQTLPLGNQNTRPYLMQGIGSVKKTLRSTSAIVEGQTRIPISGDLTDVHVGDLLAIKSQERQYINAGSHIPYKEELQKIVEVDQVNATIVVDGGLMFDYHEDSQLLFDVIDPISNVTLKNLEITMGGKDSIHGGIQFSYAFNIVLDNIIVNGAENVAVNMARTYKFMIQNSGITARGMGSYVNTPNKKSRKNCLMLVKNNK